LDLLAVVVLLLFVLAFLAAVFVGAARPARWDSTRARLVAALDGRLVDGGATVVCTLGGVEVTIRPAPGRRGGELMATVGCPTRGVVRAPTLLGWMSSPAGPLTGDDAFDRWVELRGPELEAVAPLDAAARAAILRGVHAGVRFERGTASLEIPASGGQVGPVLGQLRLLVDASRPWREAEVGVRSRLVALAESDPERTVRAWALLRLSRLPGDTSALALRLATQGGLAGMDALGSPEPDEVTGAAAVPRAGDGKVAPGRQLRCGVRWRGT
jgi:hypothetical protein